MDTYICKMIRLSFLKTETNQPAKKKQGWTHNYQSRIPVPTRLYAKCQGRKWRNDWQTETAGFRIAVLDSKRTVSGGVPYWDSWHCIIYLKQGRIAKSISRMRVGRGRNPFWITFSRYFRVIDGPSDRQSDILNLVGCKNLPPELDAGFDYHGPTGFGFPEVGFYRNLDFGFQH